MKAQPLPIMLAVMAALTCSTAWPQTDRPQAGGADRSWRQEFDLSSCTLATTGRNRYFVLEPGFQLALEGGNTRVQITVLDETRQVAGVETRVVEEREWKGGQLYERSEERRVGKECRSRWSPY